jgi:acyl-coenzyme A synthetase/AMP-(fatty) acid ligase
MSLLNDIATQALTRGDEVAVISPSGNWTFGQMSRAIASLAGKIADAVPQGQPLATSCNDPALQFAAICAALLTNRPFLSFDRALSPEAWAEFSSGHDLHFICSDKADLVPRIEATARDFDASPGGLPIPLAEPDPQALCGFLMTSGASARPKLVELTNVQLDIKAKSKDSSFELRPDRVLAMTAALSSSAGISSGLKALRSGARLLVLRPADEGLDALWTSVCSHRATTLFCSPTLLRALMATCDRIKGEIDLVRVGGETLYTTDVARFQVWAPKARLLNHYGQSETVGIAQGDVAEMKWSGDCVPVGRPNDLVRLRFLDDAGADVPSGEVGQIHIESRYTALGYRGDAGLSAGAFQQSGNGRIYNSADLGRVNEYGFLEIVGRSGRAVKIGGALVHLDAVEDRLRAVHGVAQVAVLDERSANGLANVLVAFVALEPGQERNAVRAAILDLPPSAAIPRVIHFLDKIPETSSGKIDRESLRQIS